jgi:hypothetical protein
MSVRYLSSIFLMCKSDQLTMFYHFLDAQQAYFSKSAELLGTAKAFIKDPSARGQRLSHPRGSFASRKSNASLPNTNQMLTVALPVVSSSSPVSIASTPNTDRKPLGNLSLLATASVAEGSRPPSSNNGQNQLEPKRQLMRANYSFIAENANELSLKKGDVVSVIEAIDPGWWIGELNGSRGLFPIT